MKRFFILPLLLFFSYESSAVTINNKVIEEVKAYGQFVAVRFSPSESTEMCSTTHGTGSVNHFFILTRDSSPTGTSINDEMVASLLMARGLGVEIDFRFSTGTCTTSPPGSSGWDSTPSIYRLDF